MKSIVINGHLTIPLYHGTSTLFLESIREFGLAGKNPLEEWNFYDLAKEVMSLSKMHLQGWDTFEARKSSFNLMVEQKISSAGLNFQHGNTYVSPSKITAINYAAHKLYGSELVTFTLDFLRELINRKIPEVLSKEIYKKYRTAFGFLDIAPAPILIEISGVPVETLLDENGDAPNKALEFISTNLIKSPEIANELNQQMNFRLLSQVPYSSLKIWFINVTASCSWGNAECVLYKLGKVESV